MLIYFSLLLIILCADSNSEATKLQDNKNDFDVLIFTQHWPITFCYTWKEHNKNNECIFPNKKNSWTIHGIWPTKFHTIGPQYCNESYVFDLNKISPILNDLKESWINIEKGTPIESLWSHEWNKHGTCAVQLPQIDSELKYFELGLAKLEEYQMSMLLGQANILPGSNNSVIHIYKSLKSVLNKNMGIECIYDKNTQTSYLFEIRICFDKNLELTDCDGIVSEKFMIGLDYPDGKIITNCDMEKLIRYPAELPQSVVTESAKEEDSRWKFPFVNFYKLIQLIKWFTF